MSFVRKILLIFLLAVHVGVTAQPLFAPVLKCVSVLPAGAVQITWEQVPDPNGVFAQYELYNASGILITTQPSIATTTHVHAGAGADVSSQGFYLVSVATNTAFNSVPSDTVYSIFLDLINPGNGEAWLSWNQMHNPNISGASWYKIYREFPAGVWTLVDSTPFGTESFIDTIDICNAQINYKIVVENQGCVSESNILGDVFEDLIAPKVPVLNSVSVDTGAGGVIIDWNASTSEDTDGYIIMTFISGPGWTAVDTIYGINNTTYNHGSSNPGNKFQIYAVIAFDSCIGVSGSPNTSALGIYHRTIFTQYSKITCEYGLKLNWTRYINWPEGVNNYEIFGSENNGTYVSFGTTTDTTLEILGLNAGSNYCFVIKATSNTGKTSLSNKICYTVAQPITPSFGYLATATVQNDHVVLKYFGDITASLQSVKIERATAPGGPFTVIATVPVTGTFTSYTDNNAETGVRSYYYRATAIDSCGNESILSNLARTIYLQVASDNFTLDNDLNWNIYEDWDGNVVEYNVYRSQNGIYSTVPVTTVLPGEITYIDNVSEVLQTNGEFCYYVEAVEATNIYGFNEVSHSNEVCVYIESMVWIPNAIIAGGLNSEFKPVWSFIDIDDYHMEIRNRWGKIAFQTNDPFQGWDGSHEGITDSEVFVYTIKFKTSEGKDVIRRGSVAVIR